MGQCCDPFPSEEQGEAQLEGMVHWRGGGVLLLPSTRQGELPGCRLGLVRVGRQGSEEGVVSAGWGEGQRHDWDEGELVVMGGEAIGQLCCKVLSAQHHCVGISVCRPYRLRHRDAPRAVNDHPGIIIVSGRHRGRAHQVKCPLCRCLRTDPGCSSPHGCRRGQVCPRMRPLWCPVQRGPAMAFHGEGWWMLVGE